MSESKIPRDPDTGEKVYHTEWSGWLWCEKEKEAFDWETGYVTCPHCDDEFHVKGRIDEEYVGEKLDEVCWVILKEIEDWMPPQETAKECCEHFEEKAEEVDAFVFDANSAGYELGYHHGMALQARMAADWLFQKLDIDVLWRAMNYADKYEELDGLGLELDSERFQGKGSDYWYTESRYTEEE